MTEADEVAANMKPPRFTGYGDALRWVRERMPDETFQVRANVAESLYRNQQRKGA